MVSDADPMTGMVNATAFQPGDLVEIGPAAGAVYTASDRFTIARISPIPDLPDLVRLTGRWWPPTDDRTVTLTVRPTGVRLLARAPASPDGLPEPGAVILLDHPTVPDATGAFRVLYAAPLADDHISLVGWYLDADPLIEHRLEVPRSHIHPTSPG